MKPDFIVTNNCNKVIEAYRVAKFTTHADIEYQKLFLSLTKQEQLDILYNIISVQGKVLLENIKACMDTNLTGFGTFKYREGKRRMSILRDKLAQQHGFLTIHDVLNEDLKKEINDKVNLVARNVLVEEQITKIKRGGKYHNAKVYTLTRNNAIK